MRFNYDPNEIKRGLSNAEFEKERSGMSSGLAPNKPGENEGLYKIDPRKEAFDKAKAFRERPDQAEQVKNFIDAFSFSNEGGKFYATSYNNGIPPELNGVLPNQQQNFNNTEEKS